MGHKIRLSSDQLLAGSYSLKLDSTAKHIAEDIPPSATSTPTPRDGRQRAASAFTLISASHLGSGGL